MWPKAIAFILPNGLGERFGYFGTRVLLNQYLKAAFGLANGKAKSYVHLFNALSYIFPVMGGAISDSYLGKFNTAIIFYLVALVGSIMICVFSINGVVGEFGKYPIWSFIFPIILFTLGSGSAKPCMVSFGGDQFKDLTKLNKYYAIYTMVLNIGILLAVTLIPMIKGLLGYPLAYSVCSSVMIVSLTVLISGKRTYNIFPPQGEFLPWKITKLASHAAARKLKRHEAENWLELASDRYDSEMIDEARQFLRVMGLFSPLIFIVGAA
ncbi:hypothetical protein DSO57_1001004 [Entomophthora muscae]|uniref:Uncharacterized protein n=1 Tax=Entomophthora muscae TaxID=34485 RepID=A0ACC2UJ52_9FUNG|nr:hypothetical protein DSO57_1001004 [Entomophthora muscae]